jgi:hypothetical protein
MVKIVLSVGWTQRGRTEFEGIEGQLIDVIKSFATDNPGCRRRLLGADGELLTYFSVYLDDKLIPRGERATTTVMAGSTIAIVPPLQGG